MSTSAEYKSCPFCGEQVLTVAKKCKHCGETIDVAMRAADEARRAAESARPAPMGISPAVNQAVNVSVVQGPSVVQARQSQALPALLNAFCFPGLGQLIQGRLLAAIVWWCLHTLAALSVLVGVGFVLWPIVWLLCIVDAARYQPQPMVASGGSGVLRAIAAVIALIVIVPVVILVVSASLDMRDTAREASTNVASSTPSGTSSPSEAMPAEIPVGAPAADVPADSTGTGDVAVEAPESTSAQSSPNTSPGPIGAPEPRDRATSSPTTEQPPVAASEAPDGAQTPETIEAARWRTWTTGDGKYKVEARFVKLQDGKVTLEKSDKTTVDVKLEILCPADQDFVRGWKW